MSVALILAAVAGSVVFPPVGIPLLLLLLLDLLFQVLWTIFL